MEMYQYSGSRSVEPVKFLARPDPHPHPLVRDTDLRIRIHTKNVTDPQHCCKDEFLFHFSSILNTETSFRTFTSPFLQSVPQICEYVPTFVLRALSKCADESTGGKGRKVGMLLGLNEISRSSSSSSSTDSLHTSR
jgi:hypothetical protein